MTSLKRRVVVASSTLSMFVGVLLAPSAHASTAVVLWADDSKAPSYTAVAAEYTAKTGVAVTVVVKPKLKDDLKTVQDADAPDVIIAAHDWIGGLRANNQIVDIRLNNSKEFGASTLGAFSLQKHQIGPESSKDFRRSREDCSGAQEEERIKQELRTLCRSAGYGRRRVPHVPTLHWIGRLPLRRNCR
jgi:hypothetical protein